MKRNKRFLSAVLALVLCLSMLPVSALALELPELDVLEDVVAAVEEEETEEAEWMQGDAPVLDSSGAVAINEENFPDDIFRAYVQEEFDADDNWVLSGAEIAKVEWIMCSGMGIASLRGIECFVCLNTLDCRDNNLICLELGENEKLKYINCDNNNIDMINVDENVELTYLSCSSNNLTSLNVSNNTELRTLYCRFNRLSELQLTSNIRLTDLGCGGNVVLGELDIGNLVELKYLDCFSNGLSNLDLSNNVELEWLSCEQNELCLLDISNNPVLLESLKKGVVESNSEVIAYTIYSEEEWGMWPVAVLCHDMDTTLIYVDNESVIAADVINLMKYIVGEVATINKKWMDTNEDGDVDILDVVHLVRLLAA